MHTDKRAFAAAVWLAVLVCFVGPTRGAVQHASPQTFALTKGERVCLVGNALAERMLHSGWLEALVQTRYPDLELSFRNLGFSGDEVDRRQRTDGFGTPQEWLDRCQATLVLAFFGYGESLRDEASFGKLERALGEWHDTLGKRRLVLFSALPREAAKGRALADPALFDARLRAVNQVFERFARERSLTYVDLFEPMGAAFAASKEPFTVDGVHLNEDGNRVLAHLVASKLFGFEQAQLDQGRLASVRGLVLAKDKLWFERYQVTDGYNVYGGRSKLHYTESMVSKGGGQDYETGLSNFEVMQREMEILDGLCAHHDRQIQSAARGQDAGALPRAPLPPPIVVPTNRPRTEPFLSGEAATLRMQVAAGYQVRLFASEAEFPELANPVQMSFDARGRLWVAVWPSYPHWRVDQPVDDALLILEDQDGDGRADKVTKFASDLRNPTGFEFWGGGVLVAQCPDLVFLQDTDGDDKADRRERVLHGLSSGDTHHSANSFVLGPDGGLYFQEGVFHRSQVEAVNGVLRQRDACVWRFDPRTFQVERYISYGFANPHGHVFDRWGQEFVTDGTGNTNYYALPFSGALPEFEQHSGYFPFFDQRSRPAAATEIVSSRHFPPQAQGNYLIANVIGFQGIFQYRVFDQGSGFGAEEVEPLLSSTDPHFRPSDLEFGPDGALWFLDWHNPLIGHMQHHLRDPSRDAKHGRVYRLLHKERALLVPEVIAGASLDELMQRLTSPENRVRYRARIELGARDEQQVIEAARAFGLSQTDTHAQLEALWVQAQRGQLDRPLLDKLLSCDDARARAAATRVLRHLRHTAPMAQELIATKVSDPHPRVRLEAVVALSCFDNAQAAEQALQLLTLPEEFASDRYLDYALTETLRALEKPWKKALLDGGSTGALGPQGWARLLPGLSRSELERVPPSEFVWEEWLLRPDLDTQRYLAALNGLAALRGSSAWTEFEGALVRADRRPEGHADHHVATLFSLERQVPLEGARAVPAETWERLAQTSKRLATRQMARARSLGQPGALERAWSACSGNAASQNELFALTRFFDQPELREHMERFALETLERAPAKPGTVPDSARRGILGRFVRLELPGPRRTLTLAEVELFSGQENVARKGTTSQSSMAWGGVPEKAIDGNSSGTFQDGGQSHTVEDQPDPWWELDLGAPVQLERLVIHNRVEEDFGARLDGCVVTVLDEQRRSLFEWHMGPAQALAQVDLVASEASSKLAAARAAGVLAASSRDPKRLANALAANLDQPQWAAEMSQALAAIAREHWPKPALLEPRLESLLAKRASSELDMASMTARDRQLAAALMRLAPGLEPARRAHWNAVVDEIGPTVAVIRPLPDSLRFDVTQISVLAGKPMEIVFENVDIMPHNLVVVAVGALAKVGLAAERMPSDARPGTRAFVPSMPEVLHATKLLRPGESETLSFRAPSQPGEYPFVCTFPGHWTLMNGTLQVHGNAEELAAARAREAAVDSGSPDARALGASPAAQRAFVRDWKIADFEDSLASGRLVAADVAKGRRILDAASCLRCHASDATSAVITGPALVDAVSCRPNPLELLRHVLEPSLEIRQGYESELIVTTDGRAVAGRVLGTHAGVVEILDDPYRGEPVRVPESEIEERRPSSLSAMPSGLLSTFEKSEILDLLAYLESLRN